MKDIDFEEIEKDLEPTIKLEDLSDEDVILGYTMVLEQHIKCLREGKKIVSNQTGIWCDCEEGDDFV